MPKSSKQGSLGSRWNRPERRETYGSEQTHSITLGGLLQKGGGAFCKSGNGPVGSDTICSNLLMTADCRAT